MMSLQTTFDLVAKEMDYQKRVFGDYSDLKALNLASHLIFQENYLNRAKNAYVQRWDSIVPPWMGNCRELQMQSSAPVLSYEAIIKNAALHLSCLKSNLNANPDMWRFDVITSYSIHYTKLYEILYRFQVNYFFLYYLFFQNFFLHLYYVLHY